jgi:hypothetical protein
VVRGDFLRVLSHVMLWKNMDHIGTNLGAAKLVETQRLASIIVSRAQLAAHIEIASDKNYNPSLHQPRYGRTAASLVADGMPHEDSEFCTLD